ncbi:MAG: Sip1-related alpha-galactosidase [Candidatus Korarchaeota archaeon]
MSFEDKRWTVPKLTLKETCAQEKCTVTRYESRVFGTKVTLQREAFSEYEVYTLVAKDNITLPVTCFDTPTIIFPAFVYNDLKGTAFYQRFQLWSDPSYLKLPSRKTVISSFMTIKNDKKEAFVISPLTNPFTTYIYLRASRKRTLIGGAFNGELRYLPSGRSYSFIIVHGNRIRDTILRWGEIIRAYYRKEVQKDALIITKVGYWTDAGQYYYYRRGKGKNYGDTLIEAVKSMEETGFYPAYVELDSWFYQKGRDKGVLTWTPNEKEIGYRLDVLSNKLGRPLVLHNRYFSVDSPFSRIERYKYHRKNYTFGIPGWEHIFLGSEAFPMNPEAVYDDWGRMARSWNCCGYEQDWLDTQYKRVKMLRSDPYLAEKWVFGMFNAMSKNNIPTILCMPNPAFYLAGGMHNNAVVIRTSNDYTFRKPRSLAGIIFGIFTSRFKYQGCRRDLWRANAVNSIVAWAMGMYPFFDAFITGRNNPDGFGEELNVEESLLRAMSCGPIGVGDKIDCFDREILGRLALPDGTLVKPDRPALPAEENLDKDPLTSGLPLLMDTESTLSDYKWKYLLIANISSKHLKYVLKVDDKYMAYDWFARMFIGEKEIKLALPPLSLRYFVFAPEINNAYVIPDSCHYITASKQVIEGISLDGDTILIKYRNVDKYTTIFRMFTESNRQVIFDSKMKTCERGASELKINLGGQTRELKIKIV